MNYGLPYKCHVLPKKSLKKNEIYLQKQAPPNRNLLLWIHFPLRFFESPDSFHQKGFFVRHNFVKINSYTKIQSIRLINSSFSFFPLPAIVYFSTKMSIFQTSSSPSCPYNTY